MFPNPVVDFQITVTATRPSDEFLLFDISGRQITILDQVYNETNGRTQLKFPVDTAKGLYLLKVNDESKMLLFKN